MTHESSCDLLIVGAGPAGYEAAATAARCGMKTVLLERDRLGGTCLNWGCIPTKLFLGATAAVEELESQERLKLAEGRIRINLPGLQQRKERLLEGSRKAIASMQTKAGVKVVKGELVRIENHAAVIRAAEGAGRLTFKKLILATGSRPAAYPGLSRDGQAVLDSNDILGLTEAPESLIVVGAGAIGLELAQFFQRLGTRITLLEGAPRIAPAEDPDVSKVMTQVLKRKGFIIRAGVKVAELTTIDGQARLTMDSGEDILAEKALVAVGRFPNSNIEGLEQAGVSFIGKTPASQWIGVDECLRAANDVYAVGDVNGQTLLAHAASHQAVYAARHAAGLINAPYASGPIPGCIYGAPEAVRVGQMAGTLKNMGLSPAVSEAQLVANPIAQAYAATAGFIRVVWNEGHVAGITAIGRGVAEMATLFTVLVSQGWTRNQVKDIIFPHPALDEALQAALLAPQKAVE
jgi:dihydrolipoamide dehydrogenase